MAKEFRFMPFGFVRLRTFRLSTWVVWVQTWVQVSTRARGGCVVHRCQNKNPIERLTNGGEWRHAPEVRGGFWEIRKSQLVELSPASGEDGWLSLARRSQARGLGQVTHEMGDRWKSQNRKNVYLCPYVEEPLNSKLIKSFVPELRSRKCFSCFEIPMFDVFMLWTLYVHFTHIRISWICNIYGSNRTKLCAYSQLNCLK